jgi:general secretion pathway protein D
VSTQTSDFTLSDGSTVTIPSVSGIIQALASDTDANVLSTPSILTLDNEKATIQVGQEVPVPSGTTVSSGVTTFNVTREDVGIILEITPQISENDSVRLQLKQEITGVFTSDPNLGPTLDKKEVETVVLAKNKQTIVIGGLIDDTATVSTQKIPFLGDVPILGTLFRTRTVEKSKTNLIVFITPYIVRERKDFLAILKKKIEERNNYIDMNYGKSQQKFIRKSIENHASDLLEFKCNANPDADPCVSSNYSQPTSYSVTKEEGKNNDYTPPKKVKYK